MIVMQNQSAQPRLGPPTRPSVLEQLHSHGLRPVATHVQEGQAEVAEAEEPDATR